MDPIVEVKLQHHYVQGHLDHQTICIDEHRTHKVKAEIRMCTEHTDQSYVNGCKVCLALTCDECGLADGQCSNGE